EVDVARGAVDRDRVALLDDEVTDAHLATLEVDVQGSDTHHGRLPELPGDQGGVAGAATRAGEDALGGQHPVYVVRLRLGAPHDDVAAVLRPPLGGVGVERPHADGRAR